MSNTLSLKNTWDLIVALIAVGTFLAAMYQFVIGEHYMIPTMILLPTVVLGNFARFGLRGDRWAKHILFWFGFLMSCMAFMGIFFAQRPKELLGPLFLPVWIAMFVLVAWLTWQYKQKNAISL
ncbi:MAG: hypothetical protein AAGA61_07225 [Pseudomonadota bacterium]